MVQAGDTLENPVSGQQLIFRKTAADTGGELLELESIYTKPSPSRPPLHYHPRQEERFEVLSGELHTLIDGEERTLTEGGLSHTASYPARNVEQGGRDPRQLADAPSAQDGGVLRDALGPSEGREDE